MPDDVWNPSLDDSELDGLNARLRGAVRDVLPELLDLERSDRTGARRRRVEVEPVPGMKLALEATRMRRVTRADRPVLEVWLRGTVHVLDRGNGRPVEMPVSGECRVDLDTRAILHLRL